MLNVSRDREHREGQTGQGQRTSLAFYDLDSTQYFILTIFTNSASRACSCNLDLQM